jgi:hypothetical protein
MNLKQQLKNLGITIDLTPERMEQIEATMAKNGDSFPALVARLGAETGQTGWYPRGRGKPSEDPAAGDD